jgi:TRAP-type C4-dicarboxylate transport system permease small subunit
VRRLERSIDALEGTAALLLAVVTAITFASVVLRYTFSWSIPDGFDIGRNLLGILIFWGIALAGYRGDHITVDLVWSALGRRLQRALDIVAGAATAAALLVFALMFADKVVSTLQDNVRTFDLRLPVWGFYGVAWLGLAMAVLLALIRLERIIRGLPTVHDAAAVTGE